ncbi:hypothetical protein VTO42DRAFT_6806 [Malbranchea cinnamomea]
MHAHYVSVHRDRDPNYRQGVEIGESEDDPDDPDRGTLRSIGISLTSNHPDNQNPVLTTDRSRPDRAPTQSPWSNRLPKRSIFHTIRSWMRHGSYTPVHSQETAPAIPLDGQPQEVFPPPDGARQSLREKSTLRIILFHSWLNVLLVFVPAGIAASLLGLPPTWVFVPNVIAIIPLSSLLTMATENVAYELGDTIGALLNISFGNVSEMIILSDFPLSRIPSRGLPFRMI